MKVFISGIRSTGTVKISSLVWGDKFRKPNGKKIYEHLGSEKRYSKRGKWGGTYKAQDLGSMWIYRDEDDNYFVSNKDIDVVLVSTDGRNPILAKNKLPK